MTNEMPNDGRIGKEIDWAFVIRSTTRPVWESHALGVLDRFEEFVQWMMFTTVSTSKTSGWYPSFLISDSTHGISILFVRESR